MVAKTGSKQACTYLYTFLFTQFKYLPHIVVVCEEITTEYNVFHEYNMP